MRILALVFSVFIFQNVDAQTHQAIAAHYSEDASILHHNTYHHGEMVLATGIFEPGIVWGSLIDLFVVVNKSEDEWLTDPTLVDVRANGAQGIAVQENPFENIFYIDSSHLLAEGGYDLIFDVNSNGVLDDLDIIDGFFGDESGFYIVKPFYENGQYEVVTSEYSTDFWNTFNVYYPEEIQYLEQLPLVVVSHGWTHHFSYYDYLGEYLASHGYVVISHRNDVGDGNSLATNTAALTTLSNTHTFIQDLAQIENGVLQDHIDIERIVFTGHSTGGECVVRAYKMLYDGEYVSEYFSHHNIVLVSSICPVSFLSSEFTSPMGVNYHQFLGAADTDVSGWPSNGYVQNFAIYERGTGNKQITYIHVAGHEDFHGENVSNPYASGPDLIGKAATHAVVKPYMLALCDLYCKDDYAMREYFSRNRNEFRPEGIDEEIIISGEYSQEVAFVTVIDNFEEGAGIYDTYSGSNTFNNALYCDEIVMKDIDNSLMFTGSNWGNGMTRARYNDEPKCAVVAWDENTEFGFEGSYDLEEYNTLRFRVARLTRNEYNATDTTNFEVTIEGNMGVSATVNTINYGHQEPNYPRSNGGYFTPCLEPGNYTIEVGGSNWEEEMSFSIPGYFISQSAGEYSLVIDTEDPCEELEILFFDSYGDGWDQGNMIIMDSTGQTIFDETLSSGTSPDPGFGWQNEFYVYEIPIKDFQWKNLDLNLSTISAIKFEFGEDHGSATGAVAIDDIVLSKTWNNDSSASTEETTRREGFSVYPNPANTYVIIETHNSDQVQIHDINGRLVFEMQLTDVLNTRINTSELSHGIYTINLLNDTYLTTELLIIAH
ncbi:MAG: hypothetical protein CMB32_04540 [Euryarchaeota archaeon]|nr:hypothetical protein [Euryarchaeota archaeon]